METEKIQINLGEGVTNAEVILREGIAPKVLDPKEPIKTNISGVIGAPFEYLSKRLGTGQFTQERSHIIVDREDISITLVINEDDFYNAGIVTGKLEFHPKFIEFWINNGKVWSPGELGAFLKMNRTFFPDKTVNMKLVSDLMNFTATVNNKIERSVKESGGRTDNFAQVVSSNLPASFNVAMPIFKGMQTEGIEIETFAHINGREVAFVLLSPGANQALEETRDKAIDVQIEQIREIAPNIAIIEV